MKKGIWKNKKYPGEFTGSYEWSDLKDNGETLYQERVFVLTSVPPRKRRVTFESHEAAKGLGWKKFKQLPLAKRK